MKKHKNQKVWVFICWFKPGLNQLTLPSVLMDMTIQAGTQSLGGQKCLPSSSKISSVVILWYCLHVI